MNKILNGRKFQFQKSKRKRYEKTETALSLHGGGGFFLTKMAQW